MTLLRMNRIKLHVELSFLFHFMHIFTNKLHLALISNKYSGNIHTQQSILNSEALHAVIAQRHATTFYED